MRSEYFAQIGRLAAFFSAIALVSCGEEAPNLLPSVGLETSEVVALPGSDCTDSYSNYNSSAAWFCNGGGCNGNLGTDFVVDGNLATFSYVFGYDSAGGDVRLEVKPQTGIAFPAGSRPGIWVARDQVSSGTVLRRVETRLGGQTQDVVEVSETNGVAASINPVATFVGLEAQRPFDELIVQFAGDVEASDMRVHEACVDGPPAAE